MIKSQFIDKHVVILLFGTVLNTFTNWLVSRQDFQKLFLKYGTELWTFKIAGTRRWARALITMGAHLYGEIALMLILANMMYFQNCIKQRFKDLELDIKDINKLVKQCSRESKVLQHRNKLVWAPVNEIQEYFSDCEKSRGDQIATNCSLKLTGLIKIVGSFNDVYGLFLVVSKFLNWILLVGCCYLIVAWVLFLNPHIIEFPDEDVNQKRHKGIAAIGSATAFTLFRIVMLVNLGERMQRSVGE
ncbi:unnamed protein product [Orchesella dallaii]|uniref:Uncharacterized protein n=1 Tax=Orchesella dallaii TaxID=48710 RepID=A0ABP1S5B6_9HEXA